MISVSFLCEKAIGMAEEIDTLFSPSLLSSFRENIPPVQCNIWKSGDEYESLTLENIYPFDTIDTVKRMICASYPENGSFIPRLLFVGIPLNPESSGIETRYLPIDYLWYSNDSHDPHDTYELAHPLQAIKTNDERFVTSNGSYASPNYEVRNRSTVEDILIRPYDGKIPTLHVFTLRALLEKYDGVKPISQSEWNGKFAAYFPDVKTGGPYQATKEDLEFSKQIQQFFLKRETTLNKLNQYLEDSEMTPHIEVTGVRQLRLIWKKPVDEFEGCASMFYQIPVTEKRPYMRLLPAEGSAITKLHVKGILPIPTLDDPTVLETWGKETSMTPGKDICTIKYVHRPTMGITPPLYGTIIVMNDGTINLMLQPPKDVRNLDPVVDFRNFRANIDQVFEGLPSSAGAFDLREIAVTFSLTTNMKSARFTKTRLLQRLPYFQAFLYEISPLPNEQPLLSLRYKAVSQYASEDKVFTFITQYATKNSLDGEDVNATQLVELLQDEFMFSPKEAKEALSNWLKNRSAFTLQLPEDGEFIESFNPGIDIHIHSQHPSYYFHINRVDSYATYLRIYTLLSLLFMEDDAYYPSKRTQPDVAQTEVRMYQDSMKREQTQEEEDENNSFYEDDFGGTAASASAAHGMSSNDESLYNDPFQEAEKPAIAAKAAAKAAAKPEPKAEPKAAVDDEMKLVDPKSWFINKLKEIDPRLFKYKATGKLGYSRQCAGNEDRQPAVLSKAQYDRMRDIYEDDPIVWIEYPLTGDEEQPESFRKDETITVMKFGSTVDSIHYYFCPRYFCLVDQIMVRPVDFSNTTDREGRSKPKDSCPFCHGRLITNRDAASIGHTVIKRENKPKSDHYHKFIHFLSKTHHPEKFSLPCCFTSQETLRVKDDHFEHIRKALQEEELERVVEENPEEYQELVYKGEHAVEYAVLFETIHKKYILESNKKFIEPGIFAVAPTLFDTFFGQHSGEQMVKRSPSLLKLRPNAQGFLRIGTENTIYESLLGVIAPLMNRTTIMEVQERIIEVMIPRIFVNCHFGNLVLEFYDPADKEHMPSTQLQLTTWVQQHFNIQVTSNNRYALLRLYNAHQRFIAFIRDRTQRKDLRHIQPLLAEPGLFTARGLQLLIMEDHGDKPVTIKCPAFGISMDRHRKNDIAFISRSMTKTTSDIPYAHYELYVHTSNKPARGGELEVHESILRWDYASRRYWPDIVRKRVDEYMTQCESRYRSVYTQQQGVHPMAMIPLSKAIDATLYQPEGIIKDSYNHLVGLTFRVKAGSNQMVVLPIVDDGVVSISFSIKNIYLDWDDIKLAPAEDVIGYYQKQLEPLFSLYPGYRIKYVGRKESTILAVQLENGLYIPVAESRDPSVLDKVMAANDINFVAINEFEWEINREMAGMKPSQSEQWDDLIQPRTSEERCGSDPELIRTSSYKEWKETYQQFRWMVSNWIVGEQAGPGVREQIEEIIFNTNLPEYEKRKRLFMYISSPLLSWFHTDPENWEKGPMTLLRKDCRLIDSPDTCTGSCYWKADENKCLLHVKETTELSDKPGERAVSTPQLFVKRVIDELVRFPNRRKQLMTKGEISRITKIVQPIREGDQYIIPESSMTWTNLLQLDWAKITMEESKHYEEMSREPDETDRQLPDGELPDALRQLIGEDTSLRLRVPSNSNPLQPLIPFTSILGLTLEQLGLNDNSPRFTKEALVQYVRRTSTPIGMINLSGVIPDDEKQIMFAKPFSGSFLSSIILVFLPDRAGLLVEENGVPTVKIANLPDVIVQRWKQAGLVTLRKKQPVEEEKEEQPPVPLAARVRRGPRVGIRPSDD